MPVANRSCGTCRERRILCDRATPTCLQCSRSNRSCRGYGLRLSWPSAGGGRRSIVAKPVLQKKLARPISDAHHVHISSWDVEMHHRLTDLSSTSYTRPILHIPMLWSPSTLEVGDKDLFQYFQYAASQSLTTLDDRPTHLGNILMRVALASNTPSAKAVLQSLLALSSLHRYGVQSQALELKISSIRALAAASDMEGKLGAMEVVQHVAAGMLLCSFEVHQSSCTSSQWTWYIAGVKQLLDAACVRKSHRDSDLAILMDWVYYHDVLARFTLRHWRRETTRLPLTPSSAWTEVCTQPPGGTCPLANNHLSNMAPSNMAPDISALLELLSKFCDTVMGRPQDATSSQDLDYEKAFLRVLDWRIRTVPVSAKLDETTDMGTAVELYRLAILVYVNRVSGNLLDQSAKTQQHIDKAFTLFPQLSSCKRQFPLFILGCEARTDDQRAMILDLISRTEKSVSSRSLNHVQILIQAVWAQDDLANRELNYWDKLTSIISCCTVPPSLV